VYYPKNGKEKKDDTGFSNSLKQTGRKYGDVLNHHKIEAC
jgi:hypothetical protein